VLKFRLYLSFPDPDLVIKDKPFSPRYQVFSELLQTEINYVGVLNTIITVRIFLLIHNSFINFLNFHHTIVIYFPHSTYYSYFHFVHRCTKNH